jgi:UDP-N-acetylmuramyl pentapeptide synthase
MTKSLVSSLYTVNEAAAFVLELLVLVVLCAWGFSTAHGAESFLLGIGAAALAALIWGLFAAPRARFPLPLAGTLAVKAVVFAAAVAALAGLGLPALAAALALALIANTTVAVAFRPRPEA